MTSEQAKLDEIFDTSYTLKKSDLSTALRYAGDGVSKPELYFIMDGDGAIVSFIKNGYREIHHLDDNSKSGYLKPDVIAPNPKFVSTVMKLVKNYISRGEFVKIIASERLIKDYYRLAITIWKREKNFIIGAIVKNSDLYNFVIHEQSTDYGYEKVGSYTLIEKTLYNYFNGESIAL